MLTDETLRSLIEQAVDAFNAHDLHRWLNFYAADALHFQPHRREPLRGQAEIRADYLASTWIPFSDFRFDVEQAFSAAKWLCVMGTFTGTHTGPLSGLNGEPIPPTHKSVHVSLCLVVKVEHGKAVEVHEYNDQIGLLAQLGLLP